MRLFNRLRRAAELQRRAHSRRQRRLMSGYGPVELRGAEGCLRGARAAKDARRAASGMPPGPPVRDPHGRKDARRDRQTVKPRRVDKAEAARLRLALDRRSEDIGIVKDVIA